MRFDGMSIPEMEKQRYKKIKESNEYLEFNVLIGVKEEDMGNGRVIKSPVVSTAGRNCGAKEIGCLYMTLKAYMEQLRTDYPIECFVAEMAMHVEDAGHTSITKYGDEED